MKSINNNKIRFAFGAALAVVIAMSFMAVPSAAEAYYGGSYYSGGSLMNYQYSYFSSPTVQPVVYQQPIYQQPVIQPVVYQQPVVQPVVYQQPVVQATYVQPTVTYASYYNPIYVSCNVNTSYASIGQPVTWAAMVSGGNGYYSYSWSGSDGITGYDRSVSIGYNSPGNKIASVTVSSGGATVTQNCSGSVSVAYPQPVYQQPVYQQPVYQQPVYQQPVYQAPVVQQTNAGLTIGCYVDPGSATVNQPVTWSVEVMGGLAPYSYSWTGSDNLSGTQKSVLKYYSTSGEKDAIVTVTSADGLSSTRACSNSVKVRAASAYRAPTTEKQVVKPEPSQQPEVQMGVYNGLSAATLFSLENVPWGWVVILVILVLFGTVMYLLFNKTKI